MVRKYLFPYLTEVLQNLQFNGIFSLDSIFTLLDLTIQDFLFGASRFTVLEQWDIFFENKIIIISLVLGLPYVSIFFFIAIRAIRLSLKSYRLTRSSSDKGLNIGILLKRACDD